MLHFQDSGLSTATEPIPAILDRLLGGIEVLLGGGRSEEVRATLSSEAVAHVPELLGVEALSALRRLVRRGVVDDERAATAVRDLGELPFVVHPHGPLHERIWALRHAVSAYDASYFALAEALDCPLLTCDDRLGRAAAGLVPLGLGPQPS